MGIVFQKKQKIQSKNPPSCDIRLERLREKINSNAVEVKHTEHVTERDLKGLHAISGEKKWKYKLVVSRDKERRRIGDVDILPIVDFLDDLWAGRFL